MTTTIQKAQDTGAELRRHRAWLMMRRFYMSGYRAGYDAGRADESAERDADWHRIAAPVARGQSAAELDRRRWGPGGRARFGERRPGDYVGGPAQWDAEPSRERHKGAA